MRHVAGIRPPCSNDGSGCGSSQLSGGVPAAVRRHFLEPNPLGDGTSIATLTWAFVRSTRPSSRPDYMGHGAAGRGAGRDVPARVVAGLSPHRSRTPATTAPGPVIRKGWPPPCSIIALSLPTC